MLSIATALAFMPAMGGVQEARAATGYSNEYPYEQNIDRDNVYNINIRTDYEPESINYGDDYVDYIYEIVVYNDSYSFSSDYPDGFKRGANKNIKVNYDGYRPIEVITGTKIDDSTIKTNENGEVKFSIRTYDVEYNSEYGYISQAYGEEVTIGLEGGDYTYLVGGHSYPNQYGTAGPYVSLTKDAQKDYSNRWIRQTAGNWPLDNYDEPEQETIKNLFKNYAIAYAAAMDEDAPIAQLPHWHNYLITPPDKDIRLIKTKADKVTDKINELPDKENVTQSDRGAIEDARAAYDALSESLKSKVQQETLQRLIDAEDALNQTNNVAKIGSTYYTSLADAITAAGTDKTIIKMIGDTVESVVIPEDADITLDLNGKTISYDGNVSDVDASTIENRGKLVLTSNNGEGVVKNATTKGTQCACVLNYIGATATIKGGDNNGTVKILRDSDTTSKDGYCVYNRVLSLSQLS